MSAWLLIATLAAGTVVLKVTGPLLAGGTTPPARAERVIALLMPALLSALVLSGTLSRGQHLVVGANAAGVAAGSLALLLRLPTPVALVLGALTAAALHAAG